MPRRRQKNPKLPKYVYLAKGRYVYRPYDPETRKLGREIRLCSGDAPISEVWQAYEALQGKPMDTLAWLCQKYLASEAFHGLAKKTRHEYQRTADKILDYRLKDGRRFGDVRWRDITPGVIRRYLDKRTSEGAPVAGNREVALISRVFSWAYERDIVQSNPAKGVRRNMEKPRQLYVTDAMYQFAYERAESPHYLRPAMEIAYLCRARKTEVLALTRQDLTEEGLIIRRVKGSRTTVVRWSPRLRAAVDAALNQPSRIQSMYLIHDRSGQPINSSTFNTAWQRLMQRVEQDGGQRFTIHDLKAKGVSDDQGDKAKGSGHKDPRMITRTYDRKANIVDPVR